MFEQQDNSVPNKKHTDYRDRAKWGTNKTSNIHRVVYSFKALASTHSLALKRCITISTSLKLCLATATHNFKQVKITPICLI